MSFTTNDFYECLSHAEIRWPSKPIKVKLAWGVAARDYADWTGGFVVKLANKQFAYLSGWSDSSGWG